MHDELACRLRCSDAGVLESDAADLAEEVAALARAVHVPVTLFVLPGGGVHLSVSDDPERGMLNGASLSLVGVYTDKASAREIRDDILAMPRGWEDAP